MQDTSIIFEGAFTLSPRTEQRLMLLALMLMALQAGLLLTKVFALVPVLILTLSLLVQAYFMLSARLPRYQRHLTLDADGTRFLQPEQELEWNEIVIIKINLCKINSVSKNGAVQEVNLEHIQDDELQQQAKGQVLEKAQLKGIDVR